MIRTFSHSDAGPLHDMICGTIDESYSGVYPDRAIQFFKAYHSETKIRERAREGRILLYEKAGAIVATGSLVANEISGVFVRPEYQGQGIGTKIMSALETRAQERGLSEVVLHVSLPSKQFYENLAYEILDAGSLDVGHNQTLDYWFARKKVMPQ